jgi:hypothetical protein
MIIVPCAHGLDRVVGYSTGPRSVGVHVSDIYNDLFQRLDPKRYTDTPLDRSRLEAGLSFEDLLEEALTRRLSSFRPGEIEVEGVAGSPDLLIPEPNGEVRVGEIKCTWMSCKEMPVEEATSLPPKFEKWVVQTKAYCYMCETPLARLLVYFVNGDYAPPAPRLLAWDVEFTAQELRENWRMLLTHGRVMGLLR